MTRRGVAMGMSRAENCRLYSNRITSIVFTLFRKWQFWQTLEIAMMSYSRLVSWNAAPGCFSPLERAFCDADELEQFESLATSGWVISPFFLPFLELKYGRSEMTRKGDEMACRPVEAYLLGLLAMIKCSICSYQCDNWYFAYLGKYLCHSIFLGVHLSAFT